MLDQIKNLRRKKNGEAISSDGPLVMGLSLFIILLAFFIVLNGLSQYSEPKVGKALQSLETAFAQSVVTSPSEKSSMDDRAEDDSGQGDAIQELQGVLKSLLPNLNLSSNPNPNGGSMMAVRMEKGQFERLSNNLIPLFVRILTEKDDEFAYGLNITTYVRDPFSDRSLDAFGVVQKYINRLVDAGLSPDRMGVNVESGNPAIIMFTFESLPKGSQ